MNRNIRRMFFGLITGIIFGFLLEKGGVTDYNVLIGQLRLYDFTVIKVILSAIATTSLLISYLYPKKIIDIHPKSGSIRNSIIGGLIFGVGFGLLGYCPGTIAGAIGSGSMDALLGGLTGIIIGSGIFASMYETLIGKRILINDKYSKSSLFYGSEEKVIWYIVPIVCLILLAFILLELFNL